MRPRSLFPVAILLTLTACEGLLAPTACTDEGRFALHLSARDAVTDADLTAGARFTVQEGDYLVSELVPAGFPVPAVAFGPEREGTYSIRVERSGYATWDTAGVQVTRAGPCRKLQPVSLVARLTPAE